MAKKYFFIVTIFKFLCNHNYFKHYFIRSANKHNLQTHKFQTAFY